MDYNDPDGQQIDIAISRRPASGLERLGVLMFNFGGFAGGGIEELHFRVEDGLVPDSLLQSFDLVSFDPRGVAGSTNVDCSAQGAGDENTYPVNEQQITDLITDYAQVAQDCIAVHGQYLQQLGSKNVVRDMDKIRIALGEDKINFYGASAGTRLAALYLQDFPQSSARFILDASLSPVTSNRDLYLESLPEMQLALLDGLSLCSVENPDCNADDLADRLSARAESLALEDTDESRLEHQLVELILGVTLESPSLWDFAAEPVINYINTLDVVHITDLIGTFEDFDDPAELFSEPDPDLIVERAIVCADDASRPDPASLVSTLAQFNQISNYYAESSLALAAMCSGWPEAIEPFDSIVTNTAPTSLVIGGTGDALTPMVWSEEMANQIGGVLARSAHDGHTGLFDEKSRCLEVVAENFLIDGTVPAVDSVVPAEDGECPMN